MMYNFCEGEKFSEMKILVTILRFEIVFLFAGRDALSCFINNSGCTKSGAATVDRYVDSIMRSIVNCQSPQAPCGTVCLSRQGC